MTDLITPGQERYLAKQRARAIAAGRGEKPKGFTETANQRLVRMQKEAEAEKVRKQADEALRAANSFAQTMREREAAAVAASAEREAQNRAQNEYIISKTILSTPPRSEQIIQKAIQQQKQQEQLSRTPAARQIVSNAIAKKQEFERHKIKEMSAIKESSYKDVIKEPIDYIPIVAATNYASVLSDKLSQQATKYEGVEGGKAAAYGTAAFVTAVPGAIVNPIKDIAKSAFTPNPNKNPLAKQTADVYKEIKTTGGLPSVGDYIRQNPQRASADIATGIVFGKTASKIINKVPVTDPVKSVSFGRVETIQAETKAGVFDVTNTEIAVETSGRKQYIIDLQTQGKTLPDFGTATKAPKGIIVVRDINNPLKKGFLRQEESIASIKRVDSNQAVYELLFDMPGVKKPKVLSEKELLVSSQGRIVETSKGQNIRGTTNVFSDNAETKSSFASSTKTNPKTGVSSTKQVTKAGKEITTLTAKNYPVAELEAPLNVEIDNGLSVSVSEPVSQTLSYGTFTSIQRRPSVFKLSNLIGEGKAEVDIIRTERGVLLNTRTGNPKSPEVKLSGGSVLETKSKTLTLPSTQAVQAAVQNVEIISSFETKQNIASTVKVTGTSAKTLGVNTFKQNSKSVLLTENTSESNQQRVPRTLPKIIQTPKQNIITETQQVPRSLPASIQSPQKIVISSTEQIPKSLPDTIQTPKQNIITETQQVPRTIQVPRSSSKAQTTSNIITPIVEIPELGLPKKSKKKKVLPGFDVHVKSKGEFVKVNPLSLSEEQAFAFGASRVSKTSSASFKVIPSGTDVKGSFGLRVDKDQFRPSKRDVGVVVEKSRYRINTPGELREITFKGIASKKRGLL